MACKLEWRDRKWYLAGLALVSACASESTLPSSSEPEASNDVTVGATVEPLDGSDTQVATSAASASTSTSTLSGSSGTSGGGAGSSAEAETGSSVEADTTGDTGAEGATQDSSADETSSGANDVSSTAIAALEAFLALPSGERPDLQQQDFAQMPLSASQLEQARELLWEDHVAQIEASRRAEHMAKVITLDDKTMKYDYTVFGDAPPTGRSLVLSLHGGGEADAAVNDEQWENQKVLYTLDEGIYLSPRAPTNTWNLWHEAHIDPMFERLIENFIVLEGVNPNRVYVMGYSAGGDGVYQLGPRMADHWAAASAMAGHPNEAQPYSLRNIGFTIHVGGDDTAFDRNLVAVQWRDQLDMLQSADPQGYEHVVEVHEGKGHWMDLEDAVAVPWIMGFTRDPVPHRVVWYQDDILHQRFYWLRAIEPVKETTVVAEVNGQSVMLESEDVARVAVRLRDDLVDLDQVVTISVNGNSVFEGILPRTIGVLYQTLVERGDPALLFSAEHIVQF